MVADHLDVKIVQTRILISYNNNVVTILQHIEHPNIIKTAYSGIFRYIQGHAAMLIHVQAYYIFHLKCLTVF